MKIKYSLKNQVFLYNMEILHQVLHLFEKNVIH
jgi:hypothetical protein